MLSPNLKPTIHQRTLPWIGIREEVISFATARLVITYDWGISTRIN